jgi:tryptophanyl-tRNA synthetase
LDGKPVSLQDEKFKNKVVIIQIMGRKEGTLSAAQVLYPLMQGADIFFLEADVCQLGLDQRKVNMLAREYAQISGRRFKSFIDDFRTVKKSSGSFVSSSKTIP